MHTFVQLMHTCFAMECRTKLSSICALTNSDSSFHGNPIFVMLCRMFPTSLHIHRIRIPYPVSVISVCVISVCIGGRREPAESRTWVVSAAMRRVQQFSVSWYHMCVVCGKIERLSADYPTAYSYRTCICTCRLDHRPHGIWRSWRLHACRGGDSATWWSGETVHRAPWWPVCHHTE